MRKPASVGAALPATLFLAALALAAGAAQEPARSPVPTDSLPRPLASGPQLGAEELEAARPAKAARVALGRRLFFDPVLSLEGDLACASCHRPALGLADDVAFSTGHAGARTERNAPSLWNKGLSKDVMWDGRAETLEQQALMPIDSAEELALGIAGAVARLATDGAYVAEFEAAYGGPPTPELLGRALADFLRALVVADSPVDRFRNGETAALTTEERAGLWLYEGRGGCWRCHHGPNFSDESFHNTGVGAQEGVPEPGRAEVTGDEAERGEFRTPGLRLLTQTAPYMHDGSLATLEEVVQFYRDGGRANANLSERLRPLELSDEDAANLVAFLRALSRSAGQPSASPRK